MYYVQITPTHILLHASPPRHLNDIQMQQFVRAFKSKTHAIQTAVEISRETKRDFIQFPPRNYQ